MVVFGSRYVWLGVGCWLGWGGWDPGWVGLVVGSVWGGIGGGAAGCDVSRSVSGVVVWDDGFGAVSGRGV